MSESLLSMSLDSIIQKKRDENKSQKKVKQQQAQNKQNKANTKPNKGAKKKNAPKVVQAQTTGPVRGSRNRRATRKAAAAPYQKVTVTVGKGRGNGSGNQWPRDRLQPASRDAGRATSKEQGTKVLVSNLNYDIIIGDILELYQTVGVVKAAVLNYRRDGRPSGSAEVTFLRRSDALKAVEMYHLRELDGRPMKLRLIEDSPAVPAGGNIVPKSKRDVKPAPRRAHTSNRESGRGGPGGNGGGRRREEKKHASGKRGEKREKKEEVSAEDLDNEMDNYMKNKGK